jgi:hypothetical protein
MLCGDTATRYSYDPKVMSLIFDSFVVAFPGSARPGSGGGYGIFPPLKEIPHE